MVNTPFNDHKYKFHY